MKTNVFLSLVVCLTVIPAYLFPSIVIAEEYGLADLYRIALQTAEKIKISEENIAIAEAGKSKALSYLLPRVNTFAGFTDYSESKYGTPTTLPIPGGKMTLPGSLIQPDTVGTWGIRIDENLSLGGREFTSLKISRENILKNRLDANALKEDYLFIVAFTYYSVLKAQKNLEIAEANVERLKTYRTAADKRLRVGEVTKTVMLRAEAELSGALSERMTASNALALTTEQLKRVVGIKGDVKVKDDPPVRMELPSVESFKTEALSARSDLKSLEIQKKQAEEQVRYAKGGYWPSLTLSGVYSGLDQSPQSGTMNRDSIYAGVALNFPIFEGGLRHAEVREARSREKQSGLFYDDQRKTIEIEVQSAYLDLITQKSTLKFLEDQLSFARDNYQAVTRQFELGLANSIDVMDANTLLVSAERKVSDDGYNYQIAVMRMKRATGVLLRDVQEKRPGIN